MMRFHLERKWFFPGLRREDGNGKGSSVIRRLVSAPPTIKRRLRWFIREPFLVFSIAIIDPRNHRAIPWTPQIDLCMLRASSEM